MERTDPLGLDSGRPVPCGCEHLGLAALEAVSSSVSNGVLAQDAGGL